MKRLILLAAILAMPGAALGADDTGSFRVKGMGLETCQTYLAERAKQSPTYFFARSWLNGYITAYNQTTPATYDIAADRTLEQLDAGMASYCQENPGQSFVVAATALTAALNDSRMQAQPQASAAAGPSVGRETMRRAQQALKERGHYDGSVDGISGPKPRSAIAAFQKAEDLPATGQLDPATLAKLLP